MALVTESGYLTITQVLCLIVVRRLRVFQMSEFRCDILGDLSAVEAPVFNENLVGVHASDNHAGQINSRCLAFERGGIGARALGGRVECNSNRIEELEVRTV